MRITRALAVLALVSGAFGTHGSAAVGRSWRADRLRNPFAAAPRFTG